MASKEMWGVEGEVRNHNDEKSVLLLIFLFGSPIRLDPRTI